ncbi:hypothetical protein QC761_0047950 [Podospora bellae-mahoneyi]|uniref:Uncharacterized protein n=1 Tax=Podospora bellae-mahoneyi TaxID=2093777 RepID=A0ABR0FJU6_9PEZI|nr:hypothetical protein QC761_0047950 [Podospora bellae-mahoneyi]
MRAVADPTRQKFWKPSTDFDPSDFEVSTTVQRSNAMWGFSLGDSVAAPAPNEKPKSPQTAALNLNHTV